MCLRVTRGRAGCKDWVVKLFTPSTMQKTRVITCPVMIDRFILTSRFFSFTVLAQPVITSPSPVFSTCVKVDLALTTPEAKRPRPVKTLGRGFVSFRADQRKCFFAYGGLLDEANAQGCLLLNLSFCFHPW